MRKESHNNFGVALKWPGGRKLSAESEELVKEFGVEVTRGYLPPGTKKVLEIEEFYLPPRRRNPDGSLAGELPGEYVPQLITSASAALDAASGQEDSPTGESL